MINTTARRRSPLRPDWRCCHVRQGPSPTGAPSLLFAVGRESELDGWRAREQGDLGLMLVEMGAYVFDVASFYDQLIANESYLSTAGLDGAQRRHVGLLGYLPRPGIGSEARLAIAEADGSGWSTCRRARHFAAANSMATRRRSSSSRHRR